MTWGFEEIRDALNENRAPDFRVLLTHPNLDLYTGKPKTPPTKATSPAVVSDAVRTTVPTGQRRRPQTAHREQQQRWTDRAETPPPVQPLSEAMRGTLEKHAAKRLPHKKSPIASDLVLNAIIQELALSKESPTEAPPGVSHQFSIHTDPSTPEIPPMELDMTEAAHLAAIAAACIQPPVLDAVVEQLQQPVDVGEPNELTSALAESVHPAAQTDVDTTTSTNAELEEAIVSATTPANTAPAAVVEDRMEREKAIASVIEETAASFETAPETITAVNASGTAPVETVQNDPLEVSDTDEEDEEARFYRGIEEEEARRKQAAEVAAARSAAMVAVVGATAVDLAAVGKKSAALMQRAMDAAQTVSVDALTTVPDALRSEMEAGYGEIVESVSNGHETIILPPRGQTATVVRIDEECRLDTPVSPPTDATEANCEAIIDAIAQDSKTATDSPNSTLKAGPLPVPFFLDEGESVVVTSMTPSSVEGVTICSDATVTALSRPGVSEDGMLICDTATPDLQYPVFEERVHSRYDDPKTPVDVASPSGEIPLDPLPAGSVLSSRLGGNACIVSTMTEQEENETAAPSGHVLTETVFELAPLPAVLTDAQRTLPELVVELRHLTEKMEDCSSDDFSIAMARMDVVTDLIRKKKAG